MKKVAERIALIAMILSLSLVSRVVTETIPATIVLSADKGTFVVGEAIFVTITITNISLEKLELPLRLTEYSGIRYRVTDQEGRELPYLGALSHGLEHEVITLNTGESVSVIVELLQKYGSIREIGHFVPWIDAGIYEVTASAKPLNMRTEISSPPISINIVSPSGPDALAWAEIKAADRKPYPPQGQTIKNGLRECGDKYIGTSYGPDLLSLLLSLDFDRRTVYAERLLREYPNSPFAQRALSQLLADTKRESRREFLSTVSTHFPIGGARRIASQLLIGAVTEPVLLYEFLRPENWLK